MMGISYQKKRQTPKRGADSSNLPEDARMPQPAKSAAAFLLHLRMAGTRQPFLDAAKKPPPAKSAEAIGGPGGIRTLDLSDANRTLSQLSYRPLWRAGRADLAVRPCALRLVYYTSFWPKCQADFCGDFCFGLTDAKNEAGCPLPGWPALSVCLRVTRSASFCPGASCRRSWR